MGLAALAVLALGIAFMSRAVTRPIQGLASHRDEVAGGDLDRHAPITSEDEVGHPVRAFNAMTDQLRENVATLEHRVEERTAELRQRNTELAIVNEVGQALATQLDFNAILEAVGERAAEALSAKGLSIAMKDPETGIVTFHYWIDEGKRNRAVRGHGPQRPAHRPGSSRAAGRSASARRRRPSAWRAVQGRWHRVVPRRADPGRRQVDRRDRHRHARGRTRTARTTSGCS